MELTPQDSVFSTEPETKGFDLSAGNTWIYPENYPVRDYQYNIVKKALYRNTLVCLPTGLGKTFIAAVVMYNFWRWYPFGKIVFLAPTKPLVAQQIKACYEVMGISSSDTIVLTGAINQKNREAAWLKKRIIFATPQVFHNDLENSIVPSHLVKCVVIDEAHKALGKHSYCECVHILSTQNQYFRILALSATPGNKIDNVQEVIHKLHISHLELRDENSIDIMPYVNRRKVDIVLIPLSDELAAFKDKYIIIMDRHVRSLVQYNVLRGQTANISKGRIFHLLREFQTKTDKSGNYAHIMKTLNILLTMYHAYELMIRHGLRAFYKFYQNHSDKFWMHNEIQLQELLHDIEIYLGPFPDIYPNGNVSEISTNLVFGHNKFYKLKELLEYHFRSDNGQKDTRAIVFVEYKDIVNEVYILLLQSQPIIRPQMFVGQTSQKQKQQIKALEDFRSNRVNVLISTSIGEEGLDVGEVDLIVCFDVSQHSPIRLVQRMGRTGRKRDGHIIVLVTDGKEHENLKSTLSKRDSLNNKILNTSGVFSSLYENNPRMIPNQYTPQCHKIHIIAAPNTPTVKNKKKKRKGAIEKNEALSTKQKNDSSIAMQKNASQSIMIKFLTNNKSNEQKQNNTQYNILNKLIAQSDNTHNTINPSNVKLLSDDNAGIDFLTLYAVKRSEEDMFSKSSVHKMDTTYLPVSKTIPDMFNFVVPSIKILDNLSFLNMSFNLPTQSKICEEDRNDDDCININDNNFWCTIREERDNDINNDVDNDRIRFEDILDESSDSDKIIISCLNREIRDTEKDPINMNEVPATSMKNNNNIIIDRTKTELLNTKFDMESNSFEHILNESFSSNEDNLEDDDATQDIAFLESSNVVNKSAKKIDVACKSNLSISYDRDNVDRSNKDVLKSIVSNRSNEFARSFVDEMQDFDFNTDDEFTCEFNTNKSRHNLKAEESALSITQVIGEIARMKNNVEQSSKPSTSKEKSINEDAFGWISVNKHKTQIKRNMSSKMRNKSSINCDFTTKSCIVKKNFSFPDDSDEDFIITKDNIKSCNECESSYFRDTSRNIKNDWNNEYTLEKSKNESNYSCNMSRSAKPCSTSTPTDNRRFKLSLKRNKDQFSNVINFSILKTSSKQVNDKEEKSILKSNVDAKCVDTLKQTSPLDKNIVRKIRRKSREQIVNQFIDDEADVSCYVSSDETLNSKLSDEDLPNFVSYTQNVEEHIDMRAHYLQTIKSPMKRPGAFHFKKLRSPDPNIEIYSQPLSQVQDSYLYDSFCVKDDEPSMLVRGDSILEIAERRLERNRRKRLRIDKSDRQASKKRTNNPDNSTSSEDEIEQLRIQVQEN